MNNKSRIILFASISIYLIIIFRDSWLPGALFVRENELEILLTDIIGIVVLLFLFDFKKILFKNLIPSTLEGLFLYFLILIFFISTLLFNSQELFKHSKFIILFSLIINILLYFTLLPQYLLGNREKLNILMEYCSIFSLIISVIGLLMLFVGITPIESKFRPYLISIIIHPNYVPPLLILGIFSSLFIYEQKKTKVAPIIKYFYFLSIVVQCFALLLTYSRNGMIALFLGLLVYLLLKYNYKGLIMAPIVVFIIPFTLGIFKTKGYGSFFSRFSLLIPAYIMLTSDKIKLLWGYGYATAFEEYQKNMLIYDPLDSSSLTKEIINNPHNSFISIILIFGLFFFILFIAFISVIFFKYLKQYIYKNNSHDRSWHISIISMTFAQLTLGLFEGQLVQTGHFNLQPFLLFLGLMYYLISMKNMVVSRY